MKNFVDFIVDAAKDSALGEAFDKHLKDADHTGVASWLKDKGYDVHEDECKKIVDNKSDFNNEKVGFFY